MYPSDLTDAQWELVKPLIPAHAALGRPYRYERRSMLNACLYVLREGCSWRALPKDAYPPFNVVFKTFQRWQAQGLFENMAKALNEEVRKKRNGTADLQP